MTLNKNKILIIQTAFLGDVILTTPLVRSLKNLLPDAVIDFLCIPKTAEVLRNNPHINEVIVWDKHRKSIFEFSRLLQKVHGKNYDIVLCPHRSVRSAIITQYSDAEQRIGFDRNAFSGCLTQEVGYDYYAHEIYRNLSLLRAIEGIEYDESKISVKPEFYPAEEDKNYLNELLNGHFDKPMVGLAPCSQWFSKQLPEEKSEEIINKLINKGYNVILFGSKSDTGYCSSLEKKISSNLPLPYSPKEPVEKGTMGVGSLINLCGRLSVLQSYLAVDKCKTIITVDSAATHIASAAHASITTIFGSTVPSFGFAPLSPDSRIIEVDGLECRPCTDHGRKKCPLEHFKCMYDISVDEVVKFV